jgi:hypothetical protein
MTRPTDLAVVSCHFNPCNYKSRYNNLLRYMTALAHQDVPLYLAHLVFADRGYIVPMPSVTVLTLQGRDILWHKERLLNILIQKLPSKYTKVAWIDADVIFPDYRWFQWTSELLDTYDLIQLYDKVDQLDNNDQTIGKLAGLVAYIFSGKPNPFKFDVSYTWPGVAWAAKRNLIAAHGLFDVMIVGGADTYMSIAAYGQAGKDWHMNQLAPKLREVWSAWATRFYQDIQGRVGFVPTTIVQLGHGTMENRQYVDRMRILTTYNFDPKSDITSDENGVWQWATHKPLLHRAVREYFDSRKEDTCGIEL